MRDRYGAGYVAKICAVALGPVTSSVPLLYSIKASVENSNYLVALLHKH